jgi:hypothetical protein
MFIISFAPFVSVLLWRGDQFSWWWAASLILAVPVVSTLLFHVAKPFAIAVPKHSQTLGEVARTVLGLNHARLVHEFGPSNPRELRKAFQCVVMDITGAEACLLEGDTRLIELVETTLLRGQV